MLMCGLMGSVSGQDQSLLFKSGTQELPANVATLDANKVADLSGTHRLVQFEKTPTQGTKQRMESEGYVFYDYIPNKAYYMLMPAGVTQSALKAFGVRGVYDIRPEYKISAQITGGLDEVFYDHQDRVKIIFKGFPDVSSGTLQQLVLGAGAEILEVNSYSYYVVGAIALDQLEALAANDAIKYIDVLPAESIPEDNHSRALHRSSNINTLDPLSDKYDGTGVSVAVNDDGFVGPHIDFTGRTDQTDVAGDFVGDHGDMVAGILGGAGNLDPQNEGMARGAFLWIRQYSASLPNTVSLHQNDSVMIFSSSYGNGCNDGYTSLCEQVDQEIRQNPALIQVFSCGNSGTSNCNYGAGSGWGNITGGHKQAKNVIATANLDRDETLMTSSSRGPAADGRIKPDIAANGNNQISTDPNNNYSPGGGTSAAAPGISGVLAQLYQAYRAFNGVNPESALMKASLLNSAEDFGNPGPDFEFGWGRVNAKRALEIIENNQYLTDTISQGNTRNHTVTIPAGVAEARIMLYWADYEGSSAASIALVNDLDLTVDNGGPTFLPWILDHTPNAANLSTPATTGADHLNNMEQVALSNPTAGTYNVDISGFNIPQGPQRYYVLYTFIYDDVTMIYPNGGEGLVPGETKRLYWDAHDTGNNWTLEYSNNSGTSWNTITTSVPGGDRWYDWTIPNDVTGMAMFRISNGNVTDVSDTVFSIIDDPNNVQISQVCPSYVVIEWDSVPGAYSYDVFMLGNKFMDYVGTTTALNMQIPVNIANEQWFSVAARPANDTTMLGRRAVAIYYDGSGIFNCTFPQDLGVVDFVDPSNTVLCDADSLQVTIEIQNSGQNPMSGFNVSYQVSGQAVVTEPFSGTLNSGLSTTHTFSTPAVLPGFGTYDLDAWHSASDSYSGNDTLYSQLDYGTNMISNYPYTQNMESFSPCGTDSDCELEVCTLGSGWVNQTNGSDDDIDWRTDNNGTPSNNTGPDVDHTLGNGSGKYLYLEASNGCEGEVAHLVSPCIDLSNTVTADLSFWYHMDGGDMGELHVDVYDGTQWVLDVMTPITGDQGSNWLNATTSLNTYVGSTIQIRLRGITGNGWQSDVAIDDINLSATVVSTNDIEATNITLYPNPSEGTLFVNSQVELIDRVEVYDLAGKLLLDQMVRANQAQLDLVGLAAGTYVVRVLAGEKSVSRRVVLDK